MSSAGAVQRANRRRLGVLSSALLLAVGCASRSSPPPARTAVNVAPPVRLTWLPAESTAGRELAKAVNENLGQVALPGTRTSMKSAVSMEVAQLAIECTDPTPTCYTAVGRSLGTDQMLWAELGAGGGSSPDIRVALLLYDVRAGAAPRRVEQKFQSVEAVRAGVSALVDQLKIASGPR
jgi:hypothetical protein